jgi:hypothetical protein
LAASRLRTSRAREEFHVDDLGSARSADCLGGYLNAECGAWHSETWKTAGAEETWLKTAD